MPFGAASSGARRRTRSAARRRRGRTRARTPPAIRSPRADRRLGRRRRAGTQLPRRPLEQQPPPQRDRRLARRRRQQPVQVIAREVRAPRQRRRRRPARPASRARRRSVHGGGPPRPHVDRFRRLDWTPRRHAGTLTAHGFLVRIRRRRSRARRARPGALRRPQAQDDGHDPQGRRRRASPAPNASSRTASCGSARCGRPSRRSTCSATPATRCTARPRTPSSWRGEAKIAGTADEVVDEAEVKRAQRRGGRQRAEPPLPARHHRGLDRRSQRGQDASW